MVTKLFCETVRAGRCDIFRQGRLLVQAAGNRVIYRCPRMG